jgi:hypothetical protein
MRPSVIPVAIRLRGKRAVLLRYLQNRSLSLAPQPPPLTFWYDDHEPQLSNQPPRRREYRRDGSYVMVTTEGLSNHELGEHLLEIARRDDGGEPKTGRRI